MWRRRRCSSSHSRLRGEKHPGPKMLSQHLQMDSSVWLSGKKSTFAVVSFCPPSRSKTKHINNCNICATLQRHLLHTNMASIFSLSVPYTHEQSWTPGCCREVPPQHFHRRTETRCHLHLCRYFCLLQWGLWKSWWDLGQTIYNMRSKG